MSKNVVLWTIGGVFLAFMIVAVVGVATYFSYSNQEIGLRNSIGATQKVTEGTFDATWKIISQQAQVTDKYKDSFKDIYKNIMSERYSKGDGSLMKWITEANPNFDSKLFSQLSSSIESQRLMYLNQQNKLIDLKREHDNLIKMFPGSLFLSSRQPIEIKLISSTRTENAFATGKDDDVKLP